MVSAGAQWCCLIHIHPGILGFLCLAELFPAAAFPWHLGQHFSPPCSSPWAGVTLGEAEPSQKGWEWSKLQGKAAQQTQQKKKKELQATQQLLNYR